MNCPQCLKRKATDPSVPRLPPFLLKAWRTSAVAFITDFLVIHAFEFAGTTLDGILDIVAGHVLGLGLFHRQTQAWIEIHVATTHFGSDGNFLDELGKGLAALDVLTPLAMLDVGPLGMTRHEISFVAEKIIRIRYGH